MFPATSGHPPNSIGLYWTDEELIMSLERMAKGSSIPDDVTADANPYQFKPSNLPDIWYYIRSEQKKDSEHGFWKAKGEACEIFSNSSITGLRTTLEFFEGLAPHAQKTNWIMQEYRIIQKELQSDSNLKGSSLLCRVFLSSGTSENPKRQQNFHHGEIVGDSYLHLKPSVVPGSNFGMSNSKARSREESTGSQGSFEGHQDPQRQVEDLLEINYSPDGDFLELDDLVDPGSRSFSSDNSSCLTLTSDECFDSLDLLKDIDDENNQHDKGKNSNFKFSIAASAKPDEVIIHPVTSGSLIGSNNNKSQLPAEAIEKRSREERLVEKAIETQKAKNGTESTSNPKKVAASSSSGKSVPGEKKKSRRMKNLKRKYLCFMPF